MRVEERFFNRYSFANDYVAFKNVFEEDITGLYEIEMGHLGGRSFIKADQIELLTIPKHRYELARNKGFGNHAFWEYP